MEFNLMLFDLNLDLGSSELNINGWILVEYF